MRMTNPTMMMRFLILILMLPLVTLPSRGQANLDNLENAVQGVVTVAVYNTEQFSRQLGARGASPIEEAYRETLDLSNSHGTGSGFVVIKNNKPYVVTNAHVVENASDAKGSIYVYTITREKYEVRLLGGDTFYDIAVLEFVEAPGEEIIPMAFRSSDVRVGERVYAIGNPLGQYPYSVSDGIISGKSRTRNNQFVGRSGFIQSTATIIWGNSGGPLVDEQGKVVGINSQIQFASPDNENFFIASQINFALEGRLSERLVDEIIRNDGRIERAFLGVELIQEVRYDEYYQEVQGPVLIGGVIPGSPAASAVAAKTGGQLISINGEKVDNLDHALELFERLKPGAKVTLGISNHKREETVTIGAGALRTPQLEAIARYTVGKDESLSLGADEQHLTLTYNAGKMMEYGPEKRFKKPGQSAGNNTFILLAAGIAENDSQLMFRIADLKDLGAIIRLTSLSGILDFYAVPQRFPDSEVKLYRHHFSGHGAAQLRTLFY